MFPTSSSGSTTMGLPRGAFACWSSRSMSLLYCVIVLLLLHPTRLAALGSQPLVPEITTTQSTRNNRQLAAYKMNYYADPQLAWKIQMDDWSLDTANAVEQSPFNENILYITSKEAHLTVVSATDGKVLATRKPPTTSFGSNGDSVNWTVSCNSGIGFGELADGTQFMAYSIVFQPPEGSNNDTETKTRVVAVSVPDHNELWSSNSLSGGNAGSPVIYQTRNQQSYIALTHNSDVVLADNSTAKTGHFTLLRADNGQIVWTESELTRAESPQGYGPVGVAPNPDMGKYTGGEQNQNDLVAWSSLEQGDATLGNIFAFQLPMNFRGTENALINLASVVLKRVRWMAVSRPVFGSGGQDMFMGVSGDQVRGWVGENQFDKPANWGSDLSNTESTTRFSAIPVAPTLSLDGKRLYVSTSSNHANCLDSQTGERLWDVTGMSLFLAEARVSPDDQRVYFIQSIDGRLHAFDQETGNQLWEINCDAFEEDCSNSVKANFAISRTGQYLYYADVLGKVIALKLGDLVQNEGGGVDPGEEIFQDTDETRPGSSISQEANAKSGTSVGGVVAMIVLAMLLALASGFYVLLVFRGKQTMRKANAHHHKSKKDEYATPGPDPYEDSMLSEHNRSLSEETEPTLGLDDTTEPSELGSFYHDEESSKPSNSLTTMLGASNRVAPLAEDFSMGAAILV